MNITEIIKQLGILRDSLEDILDSQDDPPQEIEAMVESINEAIDKLRKAE